MSYAITFSSPNKADRVLAIHSESIPTLNTVRNAAITSLGDTSWDVAQWTEEPSTVHRPRTPERPAVRKTVYVETRRLCALEAHNFQVTRTVGRH
jgi:hypothetical protein